MMLVRIGKFIKLCVCVVGGVDLFFFICCLWYSFVGGVWQDVLVGQVVLGQCDGDCLFLVGFQFYMMEGFEFVYVVVNGGVGEIWVDLRYSSVGVVFGVGDGEGDGQYWFVLFGGFGDRVDGQIKVGVGEVGVVQVVIEGVGDWIICGVEILIIDVFVFFVVYVLEFFRDVELSRDVGQFDGDGFGWLLDG